MSASWEAYFPQEVTFPASIGVIVVLSTILVLFLISSRNTVKAFGGSGTKYVVDEDGSSIVRRSLRSSKKPSRFEPVLHGQGETPSKSILEDSVSPLEKVTPKVKTPKVVKDVLKTVTDDTPLAKKGPGRPKKTPAKEVATPPKSPVRTRRGVKSPK